MYYLLISKRSTPSTTNTHDLEAESALSLHHYILNSYFH